MTYDRPDIRCADCGRLGGTMTKWIDKWYCDECIELGEYSTGYVTPRIEPEKPFNGPRFIWGRPKQ